MATLFNEIFRDVVAMLGITTTKQELMLHGACRLEKGNLAEECYDFCITEFYYFVEVIF
jgi:hypothetical protein